MQPQSVHSGEANHVASGAAATKEERMVSHMHDPEGHGDSPHGDHTDFRKDDHIDVHLDHDDSLPSMATAGVSGRGSPPTRNHGDSPHGDHADTLHGDHGDAGRQSGLISQVPGKHVHGDSSHGDHDDVS
jgi:hypothetical protein